MALPKFTVPSMTPREAQPVIKVLEERLVALVDTALTIKHVHWNVVGPHFIAAHEMLDDHLERVSEWSTKPQNALPPWAEPQ